MINRNRNDSGHVVIRFGVGSDGDRHLRSLDLEEDASGQLRISGDPEVPNFTSEAWVNPDRSAGSLWVFDVAKLPR